MSLSANEPEMFAQRFGGRENISRLAKPRDFLAEFSRGERRNAARAVAKDRKKPFREVWEQAYRHRLEGPFPVLVGRMPGPVPKHQTQLMDNGMLLHPTKGWRGKDGLPLGRKVRAA